MWERVGPPLRVAPEDVRLYAEAAVLAAETRPPRVLLLGVTPELYRLPWPAGTDLLAVDRSQAMIDAVWPGPRQAVRREEWTALSLPDASRDLALCDGGLHLLSYPEGQAQLVRSLSRVLAEEGRCVLRLFVPPARREPAGDVLRDLSQRRVRDVNILKLRLGMALQRRPNEGVRVADVWRAFHEAEPDAGSLAARIGWPLEEIRSLEAYRDSSAAYHFVTVDEATDLFCRDPGGFEVERIAQPSYALGDRCPVLTLRRHRAL